MLTTTLSEIYRHHACETGWYNLTGYEISNFNESLDRIVTLQEILDSNDLMDAVWALRAVKGLPLSAIQELADNVVKLVMPYGDRREPAFAEYCDVYLTGNHEAAIRKAPVFLRRINRNVSYCMKERAKIAAPINGTRLYNVLTNVFKDAWVVVDFEELKTLFTQFIQSVFPRLSERGL